MDDQTHKEISEGSMEQPLAEPEGAPAPDDDPINASGEYFFKRFGPASMEAGDPEPEETLESPAGAEEVGDETQRAVLTITIQSWATPAVGLFMLVLGLLGGYFLRPLIAPEGVAASTAGTQTSSTNTQTQSSPEDREALMAAILPAVRHFTGDPDALITVIEFSDFQCPFCGRFAADAGRQLQEEYVKSGEVRFGYVHFAFLGPESQWAAEASECAADQGLFWEYHDQLFANQSGENRGAFNKDALKGFAVVLGLEAEAFNACLDSGKYTQTVQNETSWSQSVGVQSTPTFVVNGFPVIGAQPIEVFEEVFNTVLTP
jgi:protein-disulfide isomerase